MPEFAMPENVELDARCCYVAICLFPGNKEDALNQYATAVTAMGALGRGMNLRHMPEDYLHAVWQRFLQLQRAAPTLGDILVEPVINDTDKIPTGLTAPPARA